MLFLTRTERLNYSASNAGFSKEFLEIPCKRLRSTYWNFFDKGLTKRIRLHYHFHEKASISVTKACLMIVSMASGPGNTSRDLAICESIKALMTVAFNGAASGMG